MLLVTITVALAAVAVLAAIVVVAVGGAGELSAEHPDHPPLALPGRRPVAGTDAALLRLPMGLWGYHKQITDEALERFAQELTERDTRIAVLEQELAEARQRLGEGPRQLPAARTQLDALREDDALPGDDTWSSTWHRPPAEQEDRPAEHGGWALPSGEDGIRGWEAGPAGTSADAPSDAAKTMTDHDADHVADDVVRGGDGE